jgi:hypothetical protein
MISKANRKKFSLAAIASLVFAGFAGVPAQAANTYFTMGAAYGPSDNLVAVQGASYGITLQTDFVTIPSGLSAADLSYQLRVTSDGHEMETDTSGTLTNINVEAFSTNSATVPTNGAENGEMQSTTISATVTQDGTDVTIATLPAGGVGVGIDTSNWLHLETVTTLSANITIEVKAWLDNNNDGEIDSNEIAVSDPYVVTFVPAADVTPSVAMQSTVIGDNTVSATVTFGSVNPRNLLIYGGSSMVVNFGSALNADEDDFASTMVSSSSAAVAWDATNSWLEASVSNSELAQAQSISGTTTVSDAALYGILFLDGSLAAPTTGEFAGSENFPAIGTLDLQAKTASLATLSAVATAAVSQDATRQGASNTVAVLEGTQTVGFTLPITDSSGDAVDKDVKATITLTDTNNALGTSTITSNGVSLKATGVNSVTFDVMTDITGTVNFDVAIDEAVAGEAFSVSASIEGVASNTLGVTFAKEALTAYGPENTTIAPGDSLVANYIVVNQFGSVVAGDYQLVVTRSRASGARTDALGTTADWAYTAPVVNGAAQVTIVDNGGAAAGVDTVTATIQKRAAAGGTYVDVATATNDTFTLTYNTSLTGAALTAKVNNNGVKAGTTTVQPIALETETLVAYDSRTSADAPDYAASNAYASATATQSSALVTITGTLKTSTGANITGVPVTLKGDGLVFGVGSDYYLDEASVMSSAGAYSVTVRGGLSGKQTVTITALGKTETIDLTFAAGSVAASNMVITAPATSDAGKVIDVVVKVTDANGNAASDVAVTFKSTGPGYLNALSGTTDADGEVIVKLITLTNDSGTATITATATLTGVSTAKVATVNVGAAAASSADQKVNAGSFKGYVALYAKGYEGQRMSAKVGNDWVVVPVLASNFERVVEYTGAGYTISVRIYIDRVLVDTIVVTTK